MGGKERVKKDKAPHPWTAIAAQTSFDFDALEVLADHHRVLSGFCADPSSDDAFAEGASEYANGESARSVNLNLSFAQYCASLSTLIFYGTATQQFEYLFHAYAVESERGVTRAELFQLLQDHFYKPPLTADAKRSGKSASAQSAGGEQADARHFERLYTWLKKHMVVYDRARCGFLPLSTALEMLHAHPSALQHVQLQIDPLVAKMRENNAKYREKAAAAQIQQV